MFTAAKRRPKVRNLLNVIKFEVVRSLKKPSFWIAAILVPVVFAGYIFICALVGYNTGSSIESGSAVSGLNLAIVDKSDYLEYYKFTNEANEEQSLKQYDDFDTALEALKKREIDVLYYLPADFVESQNVEIYSKPEHASITDDFKAPISALLNQSAKTNIEEIDAKVLTSDLNYNTTTFDAKDDHVIELKEQLTALVAPAAAIVLFYILMAMLGNRLSVAMTEEKENRISELLLVSLKPIHLITGKIISLMIIGIIQLIILLIPVAAIYYLGLQRGIIPAEFAINFDLTSILCSLALLLASYFLFTSINVLVGTLVSTAKEATNFAGFIVIIMIIPFMMINVFADGENSMLSYVLTYFPLSAPLSLMLRSVFNNLPTWELALGITDILVFSIITIRIATHVFCHNAVDFSIKSKFKNFGKTRKHWS